LSLTLLLDLDDTLLKNDIDQFLPKYLEAFSTFVSDQIDPNLFVRALLAGTDAMVKNQMPDQTLKKVFDATFFPLVGVDAQFFHEKAEEFYRRIFPSLQYLTAPIDGAVDFVEEAFRRGYHLAITTNPLFPGLAIQHRLTWAGLNPIDYPFDLITSYETFHFTKPDPAYFAEAMGRLGWPDEQVFVVGNDPERDIAAGRKLGLATFQITNPSTEQVKSSRPANAKGMLGDFLVWLDQTKPSLQKPGYKTTTAWMSILRSTPAVLHGLTQNMDEMLWVRKTDPDEWCLTEILCHLRDVDQEVNLPRLRMVLENDNPFIPGQDTDPWADERQYFLQDGKLALEQFISVRMQMIALLENLDSSGWDRQARHAIFGPTRLQELVDIVANHDRLHLQQVHRLMETVDPEKHKTN